ncbi:hypothetical protein [Xylella taiwanensis]|uniref:Uncharacterized protein n=1 Tax=Xylella taiwanensis TaxID=1444770 RepID=Z9JJI5_9GAMM|nr:hypothetical protein [Xylella taiwanensis]EWS78359.1 hypothetical protein AF72_06445 [Xylella taiwanensis]
MFKLLLLFLDVLLFLVLLLFALRLAKLYPIAALARGSSAA